MSGTIKALDFELEPVIAVVMGAITGVGGGTVRDLLLNRVPAILRSDIYAVAALLGAVVLVVMVRTGARRGIAMTVGALACFGLRVAALTFDWNLPVPNR